MKPQKITEQFCSACGARQSNAIHGHPPEIIPEWHWETVEYVLQDDLEAIFDFRGSMVLARPNSDGMDLSCSEGITVVIANGIFTRDVFPVPMPGRHWLRRAYHSLCWYLGRRGRGR